MSTDHHLEDLLDGYVLLGRDIVRDGRLRDLRLKLGLTMNAMAEMLHTSRPTYRSWETRDVNLRKTTVERIGRFYYQATQELLVLAEHGVSLTDLLPIHVVATLLGVPQEHLFNRYRNGEFEAIDIGILGLWIAKPEVSRLRQM